MQSPRFYTPTILRLPSLALLAVFTCLLLALVEYATHVLEPFSIAQQKDAWGEPALTTRFIAGVKLVQTSRITTLINGSPVTLDLILSSEEPRVTTTCAPGSTCARPPADWLTVGTVTLTREGALAATTSSTKPDSSTVNLPTPTPMPGTPAPTKYLKPTKVTLGLAPTDGSSSDGAVRVFGFTTADYFLGAFVPTLVAVLFAIPWVVLDTQTKRMEPFYQLNSQPTGVSAAESLCLDYSSGLPGAAIVMALSRRHWAVLASSVLGLCGSLLVTLAPETIKIGLLGACSDTADGCATVIAVVPPAARAVEALLAIMASLLVGLMVLLRKRSSGVYAEPFSVAGQATLLHSPAVGERIRGVAAEQERGITKKSLSGVLENEAYRLTAYQWDGSERYGVIAMGGFPSPQGFPPEAAYLKDGTAIHMRDATKPPGGVRFAARSSYRLLVPATLLVLVLSGLLATILVYYKTSEDTGFERFMDSQAFGVRFLFATIGVIIGWTWKYMWGDITRLRPYANMYASAPASRSILLSVPAVPAVGMFSSLAHGDIFLAAVSLCATLSQILPVALVSLPFDRGTTWLAFTICVWTSISVISVMLITLLFVFFHKQPPLPVPPRTLAATLYYLGGSDIPERLGSLAMMDRRSRNKQVAQMGLRYSLGTVIGLDGREKIGFRVGL